MNINRSLRRLQPLTPILRSRPENPTLIERIVGTLRLPYSASCLVLAVLMGPSVLFLAVLLDTGNLDRAVALTFNTSFGTFESSTVSTAQGLAQQALWTLLIFALLYMTRFMRARLLIGESELVAIAPAGEETLHDAFGGVSRLLPQLLMSIPVGLLSVPYVLNQSPLNIGPAYLVYQLATSVLIALIFGSFVWVYLRSLWGLYRFGKEDLRLRPYHEDPMLGMRPIGSISLALFLAYGAVVGIASLLALALPKDPISAGALGLFAVLGGVMFFLPLRSAHEMMVAEKRSERMKVFRSLSRFWNPPQEAPKEGSDATSDRLRGLMDLQILQLRKEYVSSIPTWPLDTGILGRFAAILISVFTVILARLVQIALHI